MFIFHLRGRVSHQSHTDNPQQKHIHVYDYETKRTCGTK